MGERVDQEIQGGDEAETSLKLCQKCNRLHPLTNFQRRSSQVDGYDNWCKPCRRTYDTADYEANREVHLARARLAYARKAVALSLRKQLKRAPKRPYRSKYNPAGLPPDQRT